MLEPGIFIMMSSIITIIGIVVAARFVYIDHQYGLLIKECQDKSNQLDKEIAKNPEDFRLFEIKIGHDFAIKEYKIHRHNNRTRGLFIDVFVLGFILIIGMIATHDLIDLLSITIILLFIITLVFWNFLAYIYNLRQYELPI